MTERRSVEHAVAYRRAQGGGTSDLGLIVILSVFISLGAVGWHGISEAVDLQQTRQGLVAAPIPTPSAVVSATPSPTRAVPTGVVTDGPFDFNPVTDPEAYFISEVTDKLCAASAAQMVISLVTGVVDVRPETQLQIRTEEVRVTTRADSLNGGAGPNGIAMVITDRAGATYELRVLATRADALRVAAVAIEETGLPVVLFVWRGAHNWVMTGFRADADPMSNPEAVITGAYILDPWYPRISTIWGPSDGPGVFQDSAEMVRNFLPWKRPEGHYPDRDGQFLILVPTIGSG